MPLAEDALRLVSSVQDWAQGWAERNLGDARTARTSPAMPVVPAVPVRRGAARRTPRGHRAHHRGRHGGRSPRCAAMAEAAGRAGGRPRRTGEPTRPRRAPGAADQSRRRGLSRPWRLSHRRRHRRHQGRRRRRRRRRRRSSTANCGPRPATTSARPKQIIVEVVTELAARHDDVVAVGVGAAGWIANDHATVLFSPHLAWRDEPLRAGPVRPHRPAAGRRERRQRRRLGRVPLRGGAGPARRRLRDAGHRHRRRAGRRRQPLPRRVRGGLRVRAHDARAGRAALRLRQPRAAGRCTPRAARWPATRASWSTNRRWPRPGCSNWPARRPS